MSTRYENVEKWIRELGTKYEHWFLTHAETVSKLEAALRVALFFLPGRFRDSEIQSEILYSILGLVTLYHDYIYRRYAERVRLEPGKLSPLEVEKLQSLPPFVQNKLREASFFPSTNTFLALTLSIIEHVELIAELLGTRYQQPQHPLWALRHLRLLVCFLVELIKAVLRLILLWKSGGCVLAFHKIPPREIPTSEDDETLYKWQYTPTGRKRRPTLYSVQRQLAAQQYREWQWLRDSQPTPPTLRLILGEILWIIRPVIYLGAVLMFGLSSWTPWVLSLAVDVASRLCSVGQTLNDPERRELTRRMMNWFFYLLRSPFYERMLMSHKPGVSAPSLLFLSRLASLPGFNLIFVALIEFLQIYHRRYFWTSGSS